MSEYTLSNGIIVSSAKKVEAGSIFIKDGKIASSANIPAGAGVSIDLGGASIVYPSLVNTHDHMQGNYLPRVGPRAGCYYLNWLPWDNDLKASDTFIERSHLSREDLYLLSAYKNLFSGALTVNDHFPRSLNGAILPKLPIRAIANYTLAHEASSYDLKWGDGVEQEHKLAVKNKCPFITHLSEGFDEEAMNGVRNLKKMRILDKHCLFIHCIGFSDEDIQAAAKAGASVSWCAASNMFMFNVTCKIRKFLQAGVNVTIGTDSSATGSINILAEVRYDRELYREMYGEDLPAKSLFEMTTANAAKAFWMDKETGTLDQGKSGDIMVLKANADDPFENFAGADMRDIELLILAGKPIYGEMRFIDLLGGELPDGYAQIRVNNRPMFVIGDPAGHYGMCRKKIGFKKVLDYLPFEPEV
ncbi:MAG: amidohydrolase family protein [Treponema sp.]|jgi:cytosine/adenosine deaminase-related metal-dependent hydrolase|nr:amidohydrolase family protein [Treponema sp.]